MYKALIPQRLVACFDRRVYMLSVNSSVCYDHGARLKLDAFWGEKPCCEERGPASSGASSWSSAPRGFCSPSP